MPRAFSPGLRVVLTFALAAPAVAQEKPVERPADPNASRPAEEKPPARAPETVVTATRTEADPADLPIRTELLSTEFLRERMVRTLPEALRDVPGVMVQKTSNGQGSPFIRGFTGFRTLLLVDGIRVNNSVFREGPNQYWATIDPLTVDRMEVVKGPSSVLYGSDAIGGTVNAITRSRETVGDDLTWDRRAYYRFGSADSSNTGRFEIGANDGSTLGLLAGGSYKDYEDVTGGRHVGLQDETGYDEFGFDAKLEWWAQPNMKLTFASYYFDQDDVERTHATVFGTSWRGSAVGTDLKRELDQNHELYYARADWEDTGHFFDSARFTLSLQRTREREDRIRNTGSESVDTFEVLTPGVDLQFASESPIGRLTYGVEWYHDEVDSDNETPTSAADPDGSDRGAVADDASYDLLGVYVQDEIPVAESATVIAGVRYTSAWADADTVDPNPSDANVFDPVDEQYDAFAGSLRGIVDVAPWLRPYGGVSQGFRAPNLSDLTRFDIARSGEVEQPATDLDPEYFTQAEVGVRGEYERFRGDVSFYYTWIKDQIVRFPTGETVPDGIVVEKDNVGDGFVEGVEAAGSYDVGDGFTAFGNFTWTAGEIDTFPTSSSDSERRRASRIQPVTGLLGLRYDSPERKWYVEGTALMVDAGDRLSPDDERDTQRIPPGGTPGYTIFALRGGVRVTDWIRITAAVENLSDVDYRVLGSGQNEPGTNVILAADVRF